MRPADGKPLCPPGGAAFLDRALQHSAARVNASQPGAAGGGAAGVAGPGHGGPGRSADPQLARRELYVGDAVQGSPGAGVSGPQALGAGASKKLPKFRVGPEAMAGLPLLLPAADAGVRIMLDEALRKNGVWDKLEIRLEVSSWSTLLAYAADGVGIALLSESAVPRSPELVVRYLDPELIPPFEAKIVCRRHPGLADDSPDLTPEARAFYKALKQAAKRRWE